MSSSKVANLKSALENMLEAGLTDVDSSIKDIRARIDREEQLELEEQKQSEERARNLGLAISAYGFNWEKRSFEKHLNEILVRMGLVVIRSTKAIDAISYPKLVAPIPCPKSPSFTLDHSDDENRGKKLAPVASVAPATVVASSSIPAASSTSSGTRMSDAQIDAYIADWLEVANDILIGPFSGDQQKECTKIVCDMINTWNEDVPMKCNRCALPLLAYFGPGNHVFVDNHRNNRLPSRKPVPCPMN